VSAPVTPDPWTALRRHTPARIALGRTGSSLPTSEVLGFALAHAQARDAVHAPFEAEATAAALQALDLETLVVDSAAPDRASYLRRPDLGRALSETGRAALVARTRGACDLAIVIADGCRAPRSTPTPGRWSRPCCRRSARPAGGWPRWSSPARPGWRWATPSASCWARGW
jgi:ethanolamine ammonia-lyase small subunit